jgi:hypothetical protein
MLFERCETPGACAAPAAARSAPAAMGSGDGGGAEGGAAGRGGGGGEAGLASCWPAGRSLSACAAAAWAVCAGWPPGAGPACCVAPAPAAGVARLGPALVTCEPLRSAASPALVAAAASLYSCPQILRLTVSVLMKTTGGAAVLPTLFAYGTRLWLGSLRH